MNWWQYLLLVNIYLVLFYVFYVLLLRKETFFQLNRIYLVTAALLSFFIPVIQADWVQNLFITQQVKYTIYSMPVMDYHFKPIDDRYISMGEMLTILYLSGILILSAKLTWQLFKLKEVISRPQADVPYSFFKTVKLNDSNADNAVIEAHEQVHAQQWHSADVLLIELVMIINWFNPVVYLYRFAIKHIHEYIADRQAVQAGTSKADYALLLLTQTFNAPAHRLVNPFFNHSLLKQRIFMLQKNKSHRISLIKYGLSAPLFILMLILSSATINNSKTVTAINSKAQELFVLPASKVDLSVILPNDKDQFATDQNSKQDTTNKKSKVFKVVEQLPEFPGGVEAFGKFLGTNIRYPKDAREKKIQGRDICSFIVEEDGSLSDIKVVKGVSPDIDKESVRVLKLSPNWKAGMQNNKKVRVQYAVPINYTLADEGKKSSQSIVEEISTPEKVGVSGPDKNGVYNSVEQLPAFPGGIEALGKFLGSNIKYPKAAREKGIEGRVICSFIVEPNGSLSNITVIKGVSPDMDEESVRVLKLSPKWIPGMQNGEKVRVQYAIPISYTLEDSKKPAKSTGNKMGAVKSLNDNVPSYTGIETQKDTIKGRLVGKTEPRDFFSNSVDSKHPPLYVLNGKSSSAIAVNALDVKEIESISVLKDGSATAIYGDKGKNGVIMMTTKK
jgi:TonB family protein